MKDLNQKDKKRLDKIIGKKLVNSGGLPPVNKLDTRGLKAVLLADEEVPDVEIQEGSRASALLSNQEERLKFKMNLYKRNIIIVEQHQTLMEDLKKKEGRARATNIASNVTLKRLQKDLERATRKLESAKHPLDRIDTGSRGAMEYEEYVGDSSTNTSKRFGQKKMSQNIAPASSKSKASARRNQHTASPGKHDDSFNSGHNAGKELELPLIGGTNMKIHENKGKRRFF
jgi:hypothetical protein